jgi:transposase
MGMKESINEEGRSKMDVTTIGIDLAKNVFQIHAADARGKTVFIKRLSRKHFRPFFANLPPCLIEVEVCGSANYWVRQLKVLGRDVRQISPQFV